MSKKYTAEGWPDHIGNRGHFHDPGKGIRHFTITDEIRKQASAYTGKVIYLQKIEFDGGKIEYRLCYYIIGKVGRAKGKWVFGQFATLLSTEDFQTMISEAREWL